MAPAGIFELPFAYRLLQAPWANAKLAPLLRHTDLRGVHGVLDVGCGPGTNARHFAHTRYVGLDINAAYVAHARRRHPGEFLVADATAWEPPAGERFDLVLLNSFLHHLDDAMARALLGRLRGALSAEGRVNLIDLVLPRRPGPARMLARLDRGDHARPIEAWRELVGGLYATETEKCYPLRAGGITLWNMAYFKLRPRP